MKKRSRSRERSIGCRLAQLATLIASAAPAAAVVISTGDGTGNTTAPADDFGFAHVGATQTNNLSGVYLGSRWVLTANHVGERDIDLLGTTYLAIPGSKVRLDNPSPPQPDLMLYRLQSGPPLPRLALSSATPAVGEELHCAGNGWNREAGQTQWNSLWEESPPFVFTGYKRDTGKSLRWGRNQVSEAGLMVLDTESFITAFDESGVPDEDAAVSGDSGGGCFAKRGGEWELVGVMFARSVFNDGVEGTPDQPSNTAVFGNETITADLFFYKDQIETLTAPAIPALGGRGALILAMLLAVAPARASQGMGARAGSR